MTKVRLFLLFLISAGLSLAVYAQERSFFIEGTALTPDQVDFFVENFRMEGSASGYTIVDSKEDAGYTFKFEVSPNLIIYSDGTTEPAPPDEPQFIIQLFLIRNEDDYQVITFDFAFFDIYEMYEFNQYLFLKAVTLIPADAAGGGAGIAGGAGAGGRLVESSGWENKWLYLRASFDWPITIYQLQPTGLIAGRGIYNGVEGGPTFRSGPLDNMVHAAPALTLGLEVQFFDFLSIEMIAKAGWESLKSNPENLLETGFINLEAGLELKVPLKFMDNIMLEPYAAFSYPLDFLGFPDFQSVKDENFSEYPMFAIGGGLQFGIKGGRSNAFFLDVNVMFYGLGNDVTGIINTNKYLPNPDVIYYKRMVISIGIGYKFGIIDRR